MARNSDVEDLLFPVELHPVFTEVEIGGSTKKIEVLNNKVVINKKTNQPLGGVNSNYKLITNQEAIELGKKCARELFGSVEAENIKFFKVDAPSTASYCHIDLVDKLYIMNLWDEKKHSDVYIPYIRITNSYNRLRAIRFDIGFLGKFA